MDELRPVHRVVSLQSILPGTDRTTGIETTLENQGAKQMPVLFVVSTPWQMLDFGASATTWPGQSWQLRCLFSGIRIPRPFVATLRLQP
jgi:hypothetical protein